MYSLFITLYFVLYAVLMADSVDKDMFNDVNPLVYIDGVEPLTLTKAAKEASGDIKDYLIKQCGNYIRTGSCELFVAVKGNLIGYMTLRHYTKDGTNEFYGDVLNTHQEYCWLGGYIPKNVDILDDFDQMSYIHDADGNDVWRLVRSGNIIHMTNPKHNQCYKNQHLDVYWKRIAYMVNR